MYIVYVYIMDVYMMDMPGSAGLCSDHEGQSLRSDALLEHRLQVRTQSRGRGGGGVHLNALL